MRVAIQGEPGSFHEIAAKHWFGNDIDLVCCESFQALFNATADGAADAAVCAIENSLHGSINEVYDLLQKYRFSIVGEIHERIHQNLIVLPGADLKDIVSVYSHPVALAQCADFLDSTLPDAKRVQYHDTAASVEYIKEKNDPRFAAIASVTAADMYDLPIARHGIEDNTTNYTRFLVLQPVKGIPLTADKSSLILKTLHTPGALHEALGVFADNGVNLAKLQSRPIPGKVWKYQFYMDVETAGEELQKCISQITLQGCEVIVLGEYNAAKTSYED